MWGEPHNILIPTPAVATAATYTVPGSVRWDLYSVKFDLTIDSTSATRYPFITVDNAAGLFVVACPAGYAATAPGSGTQLTHFTFSRGLSEWDAASTDYAAGPCPLIPMVGGQKLGIRVDGIQAADQLSNIVISVIQYDVMAEQRPDDPYDGSADGG